MANFAFGDLTDQQLHQYAGIIQAPHAGIGRAGIMGNIAAVAGHAAVDDNYLLRNLLAQELRDFAHAQGLDNGGSRAQIAERLEGQANPAPLVPSRPGGAAQKGDPRY